MRVVAVFRHAYPADVQLRQVAPPVADEFLRHAVAVFHAGQLAERIVLVFLRAPVGMEGLDKVPGLVVSVFRPLAVHGAGRDVAVRIVPVLGHEAAGLLPRNPAFRIVEADLLLSPGGFVRESPGRRVVGEGHDLPLLVRDGGDAHAPVLALGVGVAHGRAVALHYGGELPFPVVLVAGRVPVRVGDRREEVPAVPVRHEAAGLLSVLKEAHFRYVARLVGLYLYGASGGGDDFFYSAVCPPYDSALRLLDGKEPPCPRAPVAPGL